MGEQFTRVELDLIRQWFNVVDDMNPKYLEPRDYDLADRICDALGHRRRGVSLTNGARDTEAS